jgi:hypothetical protein
MKEGRSEFPESESEEKKAIGEAARRIGAALAEVWLTVGERPPTATKDHEELERHFWFRPRSRPVTRIEVDAFNYGLSKKTNEDAVQKSFWIRLIPPEATPQRYWIVSEIGSNGGSSVYQPYFIELANRHLTETLQEERMKKVFQDPTPTEMQEAAELLEECLRDHKQGDSEAIVALGEGW